MNQVIYSFDDSIDRSDLQVVFNERIDFKVVIIAAERIQQTLGDLQATRSSAITRRCTARRALAVVRCCIIVRKIATSRPSKSKKVKVAHDTSLPSVGFRRPSKSKRVKLAHTRLPSVGFRSWSRFVAVSLHVRWVINPTVGCHYFSPGLHLPSQPLRGLLPVSLLCEQRHNGCEQFA